MGADKFTPLTTPTPLSASVSSDLKALYKSVIIIINRQSPNIAHTITSAVSPNMPHFIKVAPGVTSPHIAKVTTQFLFLSLYAKSFYRPRAQAVELILTRDTSPDAYSCRVVPFGGHNTVFSHLHPQNPPKNPLLGTYNGKPMGNTYSHNCTMHRDMMPKFGWLFDLAKYLEHT